MARLHLKCSQNVSGGKGLSKLDQCFQCIHNVITGFHRPLPPVLVVLSPETGSGVKTTVPSPIPITQGTYRRSGPLPGSPPKAMTNDLMSGFSQCTSLGLRLKFTLKVCGPLIFSYIPDSLCRRSHPNSKGETEGGFGFRGYSD